MKSKVSDLSNEMLDLKKCQVDFLKIAIALFTAISSILIAFYNTCSPVTAVLADGSINYQMIAVFIGLSSIIPLLFPYISWIIIYKSRSLFRISSYLRLLEHYKVVPEPASGIDVYDFNYEKLYREFRKDPWLLSRFTSKPFVNFLARWLPYGYWKRKYQKQQTWNLEVPYKGGFYSRVIRFITYMSTIYFIIALLFTASFVMDIIASPKYTWESGELIPFYAFFLIGPAYYLYNIILTFRHNKELLNIPFSQDAQYRIWDRAYNRIKAGKTKAVQDKRHFDRKKCRIPSEFYYDELSFTGTVINFSKKGFFLKSNLQLSDQEKISFMLKPNKKTQVKGSGEVVWSNASGMGIHLTQLKYINKPENQFVFS